MSDVETLSTAAREAIRIADTFLPGASIEQRKALAMEIVQAIGLCEAEFAAVVVRRLKSGATQS